MGLVVLIALIVLGFPICASIFLLVRVSRINRESAEMSRQLSRLEILLKEMRHAGGGTAAGADTQATFPANLHPVDMVPRTTFPEEIHPRDEVISEGTPVGPTEEGMETPFRATEPSTPDAGAALPDFQLTEESPQSPPATAVVEVGEEQGPPPDRPPIPERKPRFSVTTDWEKFMGVKLFSWLGGLTLFLAIAFFIKYSFENNLIPPPIRIVLGFIAGVGLIIGGLRLSISKNPVTVQTLCATGIVVLYADFFASHAFYHLVESSVLIFLLMALVTTVAFLLAIRLDAQVVAILGLIGGFLTPILLSTGVDNPLGLFGYLAILDLGLIAVALHKRWDHLTLLAAAATVFMQIAWVVKFFAAGKLMVALGVFLGFTVLFAVALTIADRLKVAGKWTENACLLMAAASLVFALQLLTDYRFLAAARPGLIFSFIFLVDLACLSQVLIRERLRPVHPAVGAAVFLLLAIWTTRSLNLSILNYALAFYLVFAILHSVFPVVLQRLRPDYRPILWANLFPGLSLLLVILFIARHDGVLPVLVWPFALLIDFVGMAVAILTGAVLAILPILFLTVLAMAVWIDKIPAGTAGLPLILAVIGGFSLIFFLAGIYSPRRREALAANRYLPASLVKVISPEFLTPALSAILPFLLLLLLVVRLPMDDPSPVFGLAALLCVLLLGIVVVFEVDFLAAIGLVCVLGLEYAWHFRYFDAHRPVVPLLWYIGFTALFMVFAFVFSKRLENRVIPWAAAALSGPLHFGLVYRLFTQAFPNPYMGMVPAVMALPYLAGLVWLVRSIPEESPIRNSRLSLFGGAALFFVTLIFPVQFERQWITIGWALEGAALLWLYHRVPHAGLRLVGTGLLISSFVRLALNPAVLSYHARTPTPILNWYLYAYGITSACLMAGGRLISESYYLLQRINARRILYGMGTVLAFLLLNIEIADYFSTGPTLTFHFSGNLAQDMTYSLAWAAFAFLLFTIGVNRKINAARYAGFGLLTVTMLKLLLHDLWRLGGVYRIGSLAGLALVLIIVSFIYQRFLVNKPADPRDSGKEEDDAS